MQEHGQKWLIPFCVPAMGRNKVFLIGRLGANVADGILALQHCHLLGANRHA